MELIVCYDFFPARTLSEYTAKLTCFCYVGQGHSVVTVKKCSPLESSVLRVSKSLKCSQKSWGFVVGFCVCFFVVFFFLRRSFVDL